MKSEYSATMRVRFFGVNDYGTYFQVARAAEVLAKYDPSEAHMISDILELHNAGLFVENDLFPAEYTENQRAASEAQLPEIRRTVGRFFNQLNDANLASVVVDVDFEYHADLLQLLAQFKVYDRCNASNMLSVLDRIHLRLGEMLNCKPLVQAYDQEIRALLISSPVNAEYLIRKYLEENARRDIHLPPSLTPGDANSLLNTYLDSEAANPNFVELVSLARLKKDGVVDAKMKLKAKRKHEQQTEEFFKTNTGMVTGCEVSIVDDQVAPAEGSMDGLYAKLHYSRAWLEGNLDYPTILNNFIYLFEFTDGHQLLTMPSHPTDFGVFERLVVTSSKDSYPTGSAFRFKERASLLQTAMYEYFLHSKGIELEEVIAWFFSEYLKDEFGAANFRFIPSSRASTYLERCRHLFAESESAVKQFLLYVDNGELDMDLLAIASEQVRYREIPSLISGKYVYASAAREVQNLLYLLFSDQSGLTYIRDDLQADSAARLILENQVTYDDFSEHRRSQLDYLLQQGVIQDSGSRLEFANAGQRLVLDDLFHSEVASYYHYSPQVRTAIDEMVEKGWLVRSESLLSEPEAKYINYYLNQADFSNGPDLRNRYLHGALASKDGEDVHQQTYITALKILIAIIIKINDDFCLRHESKAG